MFELASGFLLQIQGFRLISFTHNAQVCCVCTLLATTGYRCHSCCVQVVRPRLCRESCMTLVQVENDWSLGFVTSTCAA